MAKKVLSIEISYPVSKVAEVDFKTKKSKVYQCFGITTPKEAFDDGFLLNVEEFSKTLKEELDSRKIKTKQVVFTVASSRIANREVMIPAVNIKKIGDLIKANSQDYFPVELSEYEIAYKLIDTIETQEVKQHKVSVYAIPKNLTEKYYGLAAALGLKVAAIDYSGNSILPIAKAVCPEEGVAMLIKIDEHNTLLTVMKDGKSVLQRNVISGADIAIETLCDLSAFGRDLTYEEAVEKLRGKACIRKSFDTTIVDEEDINNNDDKYMLARMSLTDSLRGLVSSIIRVIDYYNSRNSEEPIQYYYLTGFGGDFSGLSKLLGTEIREKVSVVSYIDGININKALSSEEVSLGEYLSCIGAAINPIDYVVSAKAGEKGKIDLNNIKIADIMAGLENLPLKPICIAVCVLGVVAGIGMSVYSNIKLTEAKENNYYLKSRINDLVDYEITYDEYTALTDLHADVMNMYSLTKNPNEKILAFLSELEDKMPSSVMVSVFVSNIDECSMTMDVRTKEEVGSVVENLRSFESVEEVVFTGASKTVNDSQEATWNFTVTVKYAQMPEGIEENNNSEYISSPDYSEEDTEDVENSEETEDEETEDEDTEDEEIIDETDESDDDVIIEE